jgi:hypothetical protein
MRQNEASPLPRDQSMGRQEIRAGCHVVVRDGVQKTKFGAGDQGIVVKMNPGMPNCEVSFSHKPSESLLVDPMYLRAIGSPKGGSASRDPSIHHKDHKKPNSSANPGSLLGDQGRCQSTHRKDYKEPTYGADSGSSAKREGRVSHDTGADKQSVQHQYPSSEEKLLLPAEHVLDEQQLSDHLPQIFICGAMARRVRVLTWNIMTQCRHIKFPNNGFGKNETDRDYLDRLRVIGNYVAEFFEKYETGVATLQECPLLKEDRPALINAIERSFRKKGKILEYEVMKTSGVLANITLWDGSQWRRKQTEQGVRALITKLAPVSGSVTPCTFVNVHLEWKADPHEKAYLEHAARVGEAVCRFLEPPGLVVVAGDFNMNVQALVKYCKSAVVEKLDNSSVVWKDGRRVNNTVDGVIWQENVR